MLTVSSGYGIVAGQSGFGLQKADGSVNSKQQLADQLLPADPNAPDATAFQATDIVELSVAARLTQLIPTLPTPEANPDKQAEPTENEEKTDKVEEKEESKKPIIYSPKNDDAEAVDDSSGVDESGESGGVEEPGDGGGVEEPVDSGGGVDDPGDSGGGDPGGSGSGGDGGSGSGSGGGGTGGLLNLFG